MKDLKLSKEIFGMKITRDRVKKTLDLFQKSYIKENIEHI